MLPDFPKIKTAIKNAVNAYLRIKTKQDPLFSDIRTEIHFEGNRISSHTMDGELDESGYEQVKSEYEIKNEEIIEKGINAFIQFFEKATEDINKEKSRLLFKKVDESIEITGNKVELQGKEPTFEHFLDMVEKIWIDFDEQGKPHMPRLVMHPQVAANWAAKFKAWEDDPANKERFNELIKKKKAMWDDKENNRKLVD